MSHHHHSCTCQHTSVRYCPTCKVAYCLDCGKEWRDASTYTPTWTYTTGTYDASNIAPYPPSAFTCQHITKG